MQPFVSLKCAEVDLWQESVQLSDFEPRFVCNKTRQAQRRRLVRFCTATDKHERLMRFIAILLSLLLISCSGTHTTESIYVPPSPPAENAIATAVAALAKDGNLVGPLEISAVRPSDHGPGGYFVCVREVNPPPDKPRRYYATFFDNELYRGARLSIIMDQCELQTYGPAPVVAPAAPPAGAVKPTKQKSNRYPG